MIPSLCPSCDRISIKLQLTGKSRLISQFPAIIRAMARNSIKDYFSICPIVQDQTREPNEEPEDLCKLKFCLCYSRITMLRVPDNLNIKTSYNQNIKIPFGIIGMRQYSRMVVYK